MSDSPPPLAPDGSDLARHLRPGDTVLVAQGSGEPAGLLAALMAARHEVGGFTCIVGVSGSEAYGPEHTDAVAFRSYYAGGRNQALVAAGALDLLPWHYSSLDRAIASGALPVDVVLLSLPEPGRDGRFRLGLAEDYLSAALRTARVVLAEVSPLTPAVRGSRHLDPGSVTAVLRTEGWPVEVPVRPPTAAEEQVAARVAALVPDRATVQFGIGAVPAAVSDHLAGHHDLGVHSGVIGDGVADLVKAGVVTNAHKRVDAGTSVAGFLMGSTTLFDALRGGVPIEVRPVQHTHALRVLAAQPRFVAINSAVEVDLTGQVNAEAVRGRPVGAVGGAIDFQRGATASEGGVPIIALASTANGHSRIVASLQGPVSTPRSDVGLVVTEHGVADLRTASLEQRRRRMLAIADPAHREELERALASPAS